MEQNSKSETKLGRTAGLRKSIMTELNTAEIDTAETRLWQAAWAICQQAQAEMVQGKPDAALFIIDEAIDLAPSFSDAWLLRGTILEESGRLRSALSSFDRAAECDPDSMNAWAMRGFLLQRMSRNEESAECFARMQRIASGGEVPSVQPLRLIQPMPEEMSTLLHLAVAANDAQMADQLLDGGYDPQAKDEAGRTPMELADALGHTEVANVMRAYQTGGSGVSAESGAALGADASRDLKTLASAEAAESCPNTNCQPAAPGSSFAIKAA